MCLSVCKTPEQNILWSIFLNEPLTKDDTIPIYSTNVPTGAKYLQFTVTLEVNVAMNNFCIIHMHTHIVH